MPNLSKMRTIILINLDVKKSAQLDPNQENSEALSQCKTKSLILIRQGNIQL